MKREIKVEHTGGFGIGWIAIAMILLGLIYQDEVRCAVGIQPACDKIVEVWYNK